MSRWRVIEHIGSAYNENAPEFLYFVTLYNIFHDFLENVTEDGLPNEATGFFACSTASPSPALAAIYRSTTT